VEGETANNYRDSRLDSKIQPVGKTLEQRAALVALYDGKLLRVILDALQCRCDGVKKLSSQTHGFALIPDGGGIDIELSRFGNNYGPHQGRLRSIRFRTASHGCAFAASCCLPFDSNSTKIGVSRYIDTNGSEVIEAQLDHVVGSRAAAAYDRAKRLELRRRLMQWYESELIAARDGAQVVTMPPASELERNHTARLLNETLWERRRKSIRQTRSSGNVFLEVGFAPDEAENLLLRAQLTARIRDVARRTTQREAAKQFGLSQPRRNEVQSGRADELPDARRHAGRGQSEKEVAAESGSAWA
jgi:predicted XRE-type DNA-binding protein